MSLPPTDPTALPVLAQDAGAQPIPKPEGLFRLPAWALPNQRPDVVVRLAHELLTRALAGRWARCRRPTFRVDGVTAAFRGVVTASAMHLRIMRKDLQTAR